MFAVTVMTLGLNWEHAEARMPEFSDRQKVQ